MKKLLRQSGFTLVEISIVLMIIGMILVGADKFTKNRNAQLYGEEIGSQMKVRLGSLITYGSANFEAIMAGTPIPGVAVNTAPTIAELKALGHLDPSYNDTGILPAGYTGLISVVGGDLAYAVTTAAAVTSNGVVNDVVLAGAADVMGDNGGFSNSLTPSTIAYPSGSNNANPLGAVPGVIQVRGGFGASGYSQFVRMGDTRPVLLQNKLKALSLELTSIVAEGDVCATASVLARDASGHALACFGGTYKVIGWMGDPVANYAALPVCNTQNANTTRIVINPSSGAGRRAYTCNGVGGWDALGVDDAGNFTVSGTATINQLNGGLVIANIVAVNSACTPDGGLARSPTNTLLICRGGVWSPSDELRFTQYATYNNNYNGSVNMALGTHRACFITQARPGHQTDGIPSANGCAVLNDAIGTGVAGAGVSSVGGTWTLINQNVAIDQANNATPTGNGCRVICID